jgi:hypothetical protein
MSKPRHLKTPLLTRWHQNVQKLCCFFNHFSSSSQWTVKSPKRIGLHSRAASEPLAKNKIKNSCQEPISVVAFGKGHDKKLHKRNQFTEGTAEQISCVPRSRTQTREWNIVLHHRTKKTNEKGALPRRTLIRQMKKIGDQRIHRKILPPLAFSSQHGDGFSLHQSKLQQKRA